MSLRVVDYLKPHSVFEEMEKRNVKIFGSFESCKDRLQRFFDSENELRKKEKMQISSDPKVVHVETIPVFDDADKKIIHVAVNTDDVLDVADTLMSLKPVDITDLDSLLDKYTRFLVDAVLLPDLYSDYKTRSQIDTYVEWKTAHKDFIKNGFISFINNE